MRKSLLQLLNVTKLTCTGTEIYIIWTENKIKIISIVLVASLVCIMFDVWVLAVVLYNIDVRFKML